MPLDCFIVTRQFNLFTGKVGYFKPSQPKFLLDLLLIWLGNLLGTSLVGYGLRLARIVNHWGEGQKFM